MSDNDNQSPNPQAKRYATVGEALKTLPSDGLNKPTTALAILSYNPERGGIEVMMLGWTADEFEGLIMNMVGKPCVDEGNIPRDN